MSIANIWFLAICRFQLSKLKTWSRKSPRTYRWWLNSSTPSGQIIIIHSPESSLRPFIWYIYNIVYIYDIVYIIYSISSSKPIKKHMIPRTHLRPPFSASGSRVHAIPAKGPPRTILARKNNGSSAERPKNLCKTWRFDNWRNTPI